MKCLKKMFFSFIILALIFIVVLWTLAKALQPDLVKSYVNNQLTSLISQKSTINGNISWYVLPRPGIRITNINVGESSNNAPLTLQIDNLMFNLKITPLLRGKMVFSDLKIDGFKAQVNSNASSPTVNPSTNSNNSLEASKFAIESLLLSRGTIIWINHDNQLTISGLQIGAEQVNLQQTAFLFQLKGKLELSKSGQSQAKAKMSFKGTTKIGPSLLQNPLNALLSMSMIGQTSLLDIQLKSIKLDKLNANTQLKNGKLQLNPLTLSLYHGESVGDLTYDGQLNTLNINQTAANVDSNLLIKDLFAKNFLKGNMDFSLHFKGNLQDPEWLKNISGNGHVAVKEGTLDLINFNKVVDDIIQKIEPLLENQKNGQKSEPLTDPALFQGGTPFKLLTMEYQLQNGVMSIPLFVLQTDKLQFKGQGLYRLNDNSINANLHTQITMNQDETPIIQKLAKNGFSLSITGDLEHPVILPDLKSISTIEQNEKPRHSRILEQRMRERQRP